MNCLLLLAAAGTWPGHELSVDASGAVVVTGPDGSTVKISYSQAKSPAEVRGRLQLLTAACEYY